MREDLRRHGPKNILEEIWSERTCAAFAALPFCEQAPSPAAPVGCGLAFQSTWKRLDDEVDGNLIPVEFPIDACIKDADGTECKNLIADIKNPYFVGDHPGLTQTLGWVDAWFTKPSVFAVAAKDANHVARGQLRA